GRGFRRDVVRFRPEVVQGGWRPARGCGLLVGPHGRRSQQQYGRTGDDGKYGVHAHSPPFSRHVTGAVQARAAPARPVPLAMLAGAPGSPGAPAPAARVVAVTRPPKVAPWFPSTPAPGAMMSPRLPLPTRLPRMTVPGDEPATSMAACIV